MGTFEKPHAPKPQNTLAGGNATGMLGFGLTSTVGARVMSRHLSGIEFYGAAMRLNCVFVTIPAALPLGWVMSAPLVFKSVFQVTLDA